MELTRGQALALEQLYEIAGSSKGTLEIIGEPEADEKGGFISVRLSIATKYYQRAGGFTFRNREMLWMKIFSNFPFTVPDLNFSHTRFMGQPHVQWGSHICLYQSSETEWQPNDGLYGFFQRVDEWLAAAGKGELDPDDAPLHPPVAYTTSKTQFIFNCDAPNLEADSRFWIGRADLIKKREGRFDVIAWVGLDNWDTEEQPEYVAAAILLSCPLPMEYPETIAGLLNALERNGVSFELFYALLKVFGTKVPKNNPTYIVVGAPMRRKEAGAPLRQHLKAWEIDATTVTALHNIVFGTDDISQAYYEFAKWMVTAKTLWCRVFENRPEVTNRRDLGSVLASVEGKRILLLGCGAIGAVVAEHLVRAGVKSLILVDNGIVSPGILVRQKYSDCDVGLAKSQCLARTLAGIGLPIEIEFRFDNLTRGIIDNFDLVNVDLIINATASASVAHGIEHDLQRVCFLMPMISLSVSSAAQCGSVVVKMPRFNSGIIAIDRLTRIGVMKDNANHPVVKAFWPNKSEVKLFQPEPGCSKPTFTGSSADLAAHASTLLNIGLQRIWRLESDQAGSDLVPAPWGKEGCSGSLRLTLDDQGTALEQKHGYRVFTSKSVQNGIASEIKRIGRTRSSKVETGGLIFGEIDDAHRYIYVDSVTGPPSDSEASEKRFLCGTASTRNISASKLKQSGGSSRFIGIWHTHPTSLGRPSIDDLCAMVHLLHGQERPPRHVMMLIVGFAATYPQYNYYLFHRKDIRIVTEEELHFMLEYIDAI
ncbi:integrative and conjugative element protein, VC0181 family [Desulfomicrobium norvegicum]|uniref:Integrative and conjugative element protein, VC0181 family n=1 Tax=Desulfomicrobium norvegicum (strain DSM 1741 / NCIMB 8310) TaxID=52561 RepID=A0A8G2F7H6_DESNO|nr:ThiF family adenylyltransferase [Desulfomicrobium norvegicum]SFM21990.1 integrative and conjugative element protein, VC0181 family [Desulfomicrobium norvegicum]